MSQNLAGALDGPFILILGLNLEDQESSGFAFDEAARIVSRIPGSEMHVVHVVGADTSDAASEQAAGLLRIYVFDKAKALGVRGPQRTWLHVRRGDAAIEITKLATDAHADMIVLGSRKAPHLKGLFVGSTAERVMMNAACPVFVAGPKPPPQPSHVIVIEAPCPDCLQRRAATGGKSWWCDRHSEHHGIRRHHIYSYRTEIPFEDHDSEVTPTGAD